MFTNSVVSQEKFSEEYQKRFYQTKSRIRQISTSLKIFHEIAEVKKIAPIKMYDFTPTITDYIHPKTGKKENFLFIKMGYKYEGAKDLIFAVTESPINGLHMACFENGKIGNITQEQFKLYEKILTSIEKQSTFKESDQERALELFKQWKSKDPNAKIDVEKIILDNADKYLSFLCFVDHKQDPDGASTNLTFNILKKMPEPKEKRPRLKDIKKIEL